MLGLRNSTRTVLWFATFTALTTSIAAAAVAADLSSPEATLADYIESLRKGDVNGVLERYEGITKFHLPQPIPIQRYSTVKKVIFTSTEVADWNAKGIVPPAKIGDVELQVSERINDKEYMFSYNFRNMSGSWKIIAHSAWGVD